MYESLTGCSPKLSINNMKNLPNKYIEFQLINILRLVKEMILSVTEVPLKKTVVFIDY
jgi:hypothetical protein